MRSVYLVALVMALTACRPKHASGSFAPQGVADGELARDDLAFSCGDEERCTLSGVVCAVHKTSVRFCWVDDRNAGYDVARSRVIPARRLAAGMLVEVGTSADWVRVTGTAKNGVSVEGQDLPVAWKDVVALTDKATAYDRHVRRFETTAGIVLLLLAIGMIVFARHLQNRANDLELHANFGDRDDDKAPAPVVAGTLDVLRCATCSTPVKLVAELHTRCPGCGKQVDIPPAYVDLVKKQRYIAEHLPAQAAALRRARIMANPLVAVLMLGGAWGSWHGFGWIMRHLTGGSGDSAAFWVVTSFPLFYLPVGFLVAAIGQVAGGRVLARAVPELAAIKEDKGYSCRGCGAPLGATKNGVAEACVYCGVQNLIASRVAASDAAAARTARSLGRTLSVASAGFWYRFDRLFVAPLYVAGAIGIILYPFILVGGLTT